MRGALRIAAALVLAAVALVAVLLATDLLDWKGRMSGGDTRFASGSLAANLWQPKQLLPYGTARSVLGLEDDLQYREAVRAFVLGHPREQPYADTDILGARGHARDLLEAIVDGGGDPGRRSQAANLIGILGFATAAIDPDQAYSYLTESAGWFRRAIALDPQSDEPKYNLELTLSRLENTRPPRNQRQQRDTRGGTGSGAGAGEPGSGY